MPRWNLEDVHRSFVRWAALSLGSPPWRVYPESRDVEGLPTPIGYLVPGDAPSVRRMRTTIPQGDIDWVVPLVGWLTPDAGASASESRRIAIGVADRFARAYALGLIDGVNPQVRISEPARLPLWDYEDAAGPDDAGEPNPYDYAWIESFRAEPRQDPDDGSWSISVAAAVSWHAPGGVLPPAPIAQSMPPEFLGEGEVGGDGP